MTSAARELDVVSIQCPTRTSVLERFRLGLALFPVAMMACSLVLTVVATRTGGVMFRERSFALLILFASSMTSRASVLAMAVSALQAKAVDVLLVAEDNLRSWARLGSGLVDFCMRLGDRRMHPAKEAFRS